MLVQAEIRAELARQKISYTDLAQKLNTSKQEISRKLSDNSRPMKDREIKKIADALKVPAWELIRRAEKAEELTNRQNQEGKNEQPNHPVQI